MSNRQALIEKAKTMKWFHAIDFGDFCSSGRYPPERRQNTSLFPVFELLRGVRLDGADCLDIGAACGLTSFGMLGRGASSVVAVDIVKFLTLPLAAELLGLDVDYRPGVRADSLSAEFKSRTFDVIVCAGVLYHMFNPMGAIAEARLLMRKGGLLVVETFYLPDEKEPLMKFNPEMEPPFREAYTYWLISESALAGMLKVLGFNILRRVRLSSPPRLAFLAQAVDFDQVSGRSDLTKRVHALGFGEQSYRRHHFPVTETDVAFDNTLPSGDINAKTYVVDFPYHVDFVSSGVGTTRYNPKQSDF